MNPATHTSAQHGPFVSRRRALSRRRFLLAAGVALALPFLDSMTPPFARAPAKDRTPPIPSLARFAGA